MYVASFNKNNELSTFYKKIYYISLLLGLCNVLVIYSFSKFTRRFIINHYNIYLAFLSCYEQVGFNIHIFFTFMPNLSSVYVRI